MAAINRDHLPGAEALPPARDASALPTCVLNADLVCVVQLQLVRRRPPIICSGRFSKLWPRQLVRGFWVARCRSVPPHARRGSGHCSGALGGSCSPGPTSAWSGDQPAVGWTREGWSGSDGEEGGTLCSAVRHRRAWSRHSAAVRATLTRIPAAAATATGTRPPPSPPTAKATKTPPIMLVVTATMVAAWDSRCRLEAARPMLAGAPWMSSWPPSRNQDGAAGSSSR
jgi:hypothetical protein